jgi:hypothetical protein
MNIFLSAICGRCVIAKTCMLTLISFMISPIFIAISPETPVSISSKNQVGSFVYLAKIALTASIIQTSHLQKLLFNKPKSVPLLAANKTEVHLTVIMVSSGESELGYRIGHYAFLTYLK